MKTTKPYIIADVSCSLLEHDSQDSLDSAIDFRDDHLRLLLRRLSRAPDRPGPAARLGRLGPRVKYGGPGLAG